MVKCDKCDKEATEEVEIGFRSIKVKIPLCYQHWIEWEKKTVHFKEVHDAIVSGSIGGN